MTLFERYDNVWEALDIPEPSDMDLVEARAALAEYHRMGGKTLEQVKIELGDDVS